MIFCHPTLRFVALILPFLQILPIYLPPLIQLFLLTLYPFLLLPIPTFPLTRDAFPIPSFLLTLVRMFAPESILLATIPLDPILPLLSAYQTLPWNFEIFTPVQLAHHISIIIQ